jgi:site-specific DNA-methyltransferase (adenine-specific)
MEFNKIYNEDCISGMKKLPDNSVDLIVTSPPYNLNIQYAGHKDDMTLENYYEWCKE